MTLALANQASTLLTFLVGVLSGFALFLLLYLLTVVVGIKKTSKKQKERISPILKKEIKWIVDDCKKEYSNHRIREEHGDFNYFKILSFRMIKDIASKFSPKSKMPHLEISLAEIIVLTRYISQRMDEILNTKVLRLFKNMTIKRIIDIKNAEKAISNSSIVKGAKISGADKVLKILQLFNPVYWFRKGVFEPIVNKIIFKITLNFIEIIAEESYNVYSKVLFRNDEDKKFFEEEDIKKMKQLDEIYNNIKEEGADK